MALATALAALFAALALGAAPAAAAPAAGPIETFHYTGGPQTFTVPDDVSYLTFDVTGGRGGFPTEGGAPGPGGETIAGLDVTPGQKLTIWVGENAGGSGGWGYSCGGDHGIATEHIPQSAFDGGGGGGSSAVTDGEWTQGAGTCSSSTRPAGQPLIVGGGGGGGGGREHIPLTNYEGGAGGAGGSPAQPGFAGQGAEPGLGGKIGEGVDDEGGGGSSDDQSSSDTMGGGGGGGGGYTTGGEGGGGGGRLPGGNGNIFGGGGGAGGTSFASGATSRPVYLAGPLGGSGVVTVSAVREEGFECAGFVQHPSVPAGVQYAHVTVEGGAGGNRSASSERPPGKGGHGGIVSADLAGFAWDKLNVFVGCAGSDHDGGSGYGYGKGGEKGTANSEDGDDGAGGGGGSALEIGQFPVVVAGGGGGAGGGAETLGETIEGGNGGNGGPPGDHSTPGHDGGREVGGDGGCPGSEFEHHLNGANGGGSSTGSGGGGGGGGGGGWGGACGGEGGNFPNGGGGGGGGGGSYALPHSAAVTNAKFSTSGGDESNGKILLSYVVSEPTHLSPFSGSGQQVPIGGTFPKRLVAQVVDQEGRPMQGVPLTFFVPTAVGAPSGRFAGGAEFADATTDLHGLATSPPLSANLVTGSWQAEAKITGLAPAEFSLANTVRPTATALGASANPALAGEPVTFTATVKGTSGGPAPTGAVQFTSDGSALGAPVPLSGASAQKSAALTLGSHAIEATFVPDDGFQTSHAKLTEKVEKATSGTAVSSSANPSEFAEAVTFTAQVTHTGSQTAAGTVQFEVDGAPFGTPVALSGGTATSGSTAALAVAAHEVVAKYSGDGSIAASEGRLTQSVGADATATELSSGANPSVYGQPVTYTATVEAHGADTPTGTIAFLVDGTQACEATLAAGAADCEPAAALAPGSHEVRAEYAGDADFDPSHGTLTETVAQAPTATAVSADLESPRFGQPVSFSAAVSVPAPGGGVPTGVVQFFLGDQPLGAPVNVSGGVATTPPISTLPVGVDAISATYLGDANHAGSSETLFEEVSQGETTTTLTSSANPTRFGVPVTFTATVAPRAPAAGELGGTVRFSLDGSAICDVPLDAAGEARCAAPTLYVGDHDVVASYSGEADFEPSDGTLTESVVRVPSLTVASTSASRVEAGQPLTLSAEVGGLPPETPAGTVTFSSGSQVLGTVPVEQAEVGEARAELETGALAAGSHEIVARYSGDEAIDPSSSLPITQVVVGKADGPPTPAAACIARNVRARVLVFRQRDRVRLVARNVAAAPARVTIRFSDEHGSGSRLLGKLTRQVAGGGMARVAAALPAAEMKRLRSAHGGFAVAVTVDAAGGNCAVQSKRPLSVRRLVSGQRVWFQRDSIRTDLPSNSD